MNHKTIGLGIATLLLTAACGGSSSNAPPAQTANATTTSGAASTDTENARQQPAMNGTPGMNDPQVSQRNGEMTMPMPAPSDAPMTTTPGTSPAAATDSSNDTMNDAQIAAVIETANNGEIQQAQVALKSAKDRRVHQFAQHMVSDHQKAQASLQALDKKQSRTPQETAFSTQLKDGGDKVMSQLRASNGGDFDSTYMTAQVDQHAKVLEALDRYLANASDGEMKSLVQQTRTKVADHLKMARDIQQSLTKK